MIFGDHFGNIRAIGENGSEILLNIFPYLTNDQIWGSPILDDIDLDGNLDVIFISKDGNVYVLDKFGLKWSYATESRLIGTPSLLNINDSSELEIVVAGYSNNQDNFYIFSFDGILIDQIEISEKINTIEIVIAEQTYFVPMKEDNRHYDEIKRQVEAGELTIEEAD